MTLTFDQTLGLSHPFSVGKNVHSIIANPNPSGTFYADIAARDADTAFQVVENVGKAVAVTSPLSIFVLMSTGPAVWLELSSTLTDSFLELTDTPSSYSGEALKVARVNAGETGLEFFADGGGDVVGPASSTDNALARFDLTTGKLIQNSVALLSDAGVLSGLTQLDVGNLSFFTNTIVNATSQIFIESGSSNDPLVMIGPGLGSPVLFNIRSGITTSGKLGELGTGGIGLTESFGQIGWKNFGDLELGPRSDAVADIAFYTPNSGLTSLVERMRIKTSDGEVLIGDLSLLGNTISSLGAGQDIILAPNGAGATFTENDIAILNANLSIFGTSGAAFLRDVKISADLISHIDHHNSTDYSLQQIADGETHLNAPTGKTIQFKINNTSIGNVDNTGFNFGNLRLSVNTLSTINTNGDLLLAPDGTGLIDVTTRRIINVVDPTADQDVATKKYVDDQQLLFDTFLELTDTPASYSGQGLKFARVNAGETALEFASGVGDVVGPASSTNTALAVFDGTTGKLLKNSPHLVDATTGKILFDVSESVVARFRMGGFSGNPALIEIEDTASIRARYGYFGTAGLINAASFAQIGVATNGAVQIAPRGNFSGGGIQLFTPNVALDTLILRMRIDDGTGQTTFTATTDSLLNLQRTVGGGIPAYISLGDIGFSRGRLGYFGNVGLVDAITAGQIGFSFNGGCVYASRGNFAGGGHKFFTPNSGLTTLIERMRIEDDTGRVCIGPTPPVPDSLLHSHIGTAGSVTALAGTNLTLESNATQYLQFLVPDGATSGILFGEESSNVENGIFADSTNGMQFRVAGNQNLLCLDINLRVGIGEVVPDSKLHVRAGPSGAGVAPAGTTLTLESNATNFITMLQPNANGAGIIFGDPDVLVAGAFSYSAADDFLWATVTNALKMTLTSDGILKILNAATAGTGQLTIGTATAVAGASITLENASALMCGQLTGGSGKWQIRTGSGVVQFGSVQPTATGIISNNTIRTQWDQTDGRMRHFYGVTSQKKNVADADYTILSTDNRITVTSITAARIFTIPTAEIAKGSASEAREWSFKDQSGDVDGIKTITIATEGSETIDGATSLVLNTPYFNFKLYADGSNVFVEAA